MNVSIIRNLIKNLIAITRKYLIEFINNKYLNILLASFIYYIKKTVQKHCNYFKMDEQHEGERQQRNALEQLQEQIVEDQREMNDLVQAVGNEIDAFLEEAEAFMHELEDIDDNDDVDSDVMDDDSGDELFLDDDEEAVDLMNLEEESDMDVADEDATEESDEDHNSSYAVRYKRRSLLAYKSKTQIYCCRPLHIQKCIYTSKSEPCARSGHRVIADESNLYSLGGYHPSSTLNMRQGMHSSLLFQELWRYNFATTSWHLILNGETARNMPTELASNALVMHNNKLIAHGGTGYPFGELCSNDCYVYSIGSKPNVSCLKVTGDLPVAQYGPGIVIHDDHLYTIGGTTGFDYSCDVYRLNLKTRVWERVYRSRPEMRDDPEGRYRHEVVYDGSYIYVLGGGTSHSVYDLQRIPAFNLKLNRWDYFETLADRTLIKPGLNATEGYPRPRKCFSCVQHENSAGEVEAFITGGLQVVLEGMGEGDMRSYFGDIWRLNLNTKQWTYIRTASLPKPLYFHSAAHSGNGCMWIFGGIEYSLKDNHRRNYMFKMWMTVPRLSEMAWEAVTYYNERLNHYDRSSLLAAGLPDRFVQRIASLKDKPRHAANKLN